MMFQIALIIGIIILLVKVYRGRKTSGKIIFKLILAILAVILTFCFIGAAMESCDSYNYLRERKTDENRKRELDDYLEDGRLDRLAGHMDLFNYYEEEYDSYWQIIIDSENNELTRELEN